MKRLLLFATTMLLAASNNEVVVATENVYAEKANIEAVVSAGPKVYSNCYDGCLNVRIQPTTKSQVVGRLNNGPEGAELLGVEGNWSKVRVNDVVGYLWSKGLRSTLLSQHISTPLQLLVLGSWLVLLGVRPTKSRVTESSIILLRSTQTVLGVCLAIKLFSSIIRHGCDW